LKVLFVAPALPWPPTSGGAIRTHAMLRELRGRAEIALRAVSETPLPKGWEALLEITSSIQVFERSPPPPWAGLTRCKRERWFHSDALRRALSEELPGPYDLVHLDELAVFPSLPRKRNVPLVLHHHKLDLEFQRALPTAPGWRGAFDASKLGRLEARAARAVPHQITCSAEDASILRRRYPWLSCTAVPSGVDVEYFRCSARQGARERDLLLHLGTMSYGPNADAASWLVRSILPIVRLARPSVRLAIVGRNPPPEVTALAGEGVVVTGEVEDVRPWLQRAAMLVAPLRIGGGTRLKIVEALAAGCPVVSTAVGAEGLDLRSGEHLRLAEGPQALAAAILDLLENPARADALAREGCAAVREHYAWPVLSERLLAAWQDAARPTRPGPRCSGSSARQPNQEPP
jgi:glycosyltransferase involved in cell wall biosynthesis